MMSKLLKGEGFLTDHYDPKKKVVSLSPANYDRPSVAGTAIAAHEVGHAIQDHQGYWFLRFRAALVPVANLGFIKLYDHHVRYYLNSDR